MYYHLKSGPVFNWFNHLNTGHLKVWCSDGYCIGHLVARNIQLLDNCLSTFLMVKNHVMSMTIPIAVWLLKLHPFVGLTLVCYYLIQG